MVKKITGLSVVEAKKLLTTYGLNQPAPPHEIKFFDIVKEELSEPMMLLLMAVGLIYSFWGKAEDAITIFTIIFIMVFVEVWNEFKAKKAIAALSKLAAPKTKVLRDGELVEIKTEFVVPGDVLILNSGTRISADGKLLTAISLQVDESSLTGESLPVIKKIGDDIFAGTLVVSGEARAQVVFTGISTKFGKISSLAAVIKPPKTPLQIAMKKLSGNLVWVALFFSIAIPILGLLRGQNLKEMILTGLALSFSVIPEELPFVITLILGLGAYQLSKNRFLIKKIKAAEVLGDTTVILTDKTGTLTEGNMKVVSVFPKAQEKNIIKFASILLTEGSLFSTDKAIQAKAQEYKIETTEGESLRERSFTDGRKTKTILKKIDGKVYLFISGAPEEIFSRTLGNISKYQYELTQETNMGRRVIAVATKTISASDINKDFHILEKNLTLIGLISIEDSPRPGVKDALELAKKAGIRTIMVTGDHPQTALYIAKLVGIQSDKSITGAELNKISDQDLQTVVNQVAVFARSTPEHKYRLLKALQSNGEIVVVTGDGINDVLALKGANIGIAMGIKGTDAAKEAADVVLADDNYGTIAHAIFEGRKFYDNLRKGVSYYLSAKAALVLIFLLPVVIGVPFPFAPIQIILLEMFMDLAASSGFVAEPAEKTIYQKSLRGSEEKIMGKKMLIDVGLSSLSLFAAVIIPYFFALKYFPEQAQTIAFSSWMIGHIILAFVSRSTHEPLFSLGIFSNKVMNIWGLSAILLLFLTMTIPILGSQLKLSPISLNQFGEIFIVVLIIISWKEIIKVFRYNRFFVVPDKGSET